MSLSTHGAVRWLGRAEDLCNTAILCLMTILPLIEIVVRPFDSGVPGSIQYVGLLTMWLGFSGAMLAMRDGKHLSMSTGVALLGGRLAVAARTLSILVTTSVTVALAYGAYVLVRADMASTQVLPGGVPAWIAQVAMPIGYGVVAFRAVVTGFRRWHVRLVLLVVVAIIVGIAAQIEPDEAGSIAYLALGMIAVATALGAPIYVALGGAAVVLFWADAEPIAAVAAATVAQIKHEMVPAIPLFTFTGYILAESKTSERLVRVFRALLGWLPGGMTVMTVGVCAFFTTFTGASGVTILALGGLLYPVLRKEKYSEDFSVGLLTASGSIGLLFPPALPVILYGVKAQVPIDRMFVAGFVPGMVLVLALSALGMRAGIARKVPRTKFDFSEAIAALREAKWEILLPAIVVGGLFSGWMGLVEAAAVTAAYAFFVEAVLYRDISIRRDLVRIARECATLVGGVLIILGVAMGFTNYLVDAGVPDAALEWVEQGIHSKFAFLIALNFFLLAVGCLMDIFSAIVVVVPLVLPISEHFGIDPIHLGIIFLANLELGFLTPPVGMNLFLASYRFKAPLTRVYRFALPFLVVLFLCVLLITYVPEFTLWPVEWVFGAAPEPPPIKF
ncbi:MAG: TRAP transporter large permease subunit [Deltaproteobacteria bacterium]|nr:TRAP transporter large permease subunit [Deltaproteobacteria bacterium]